MLKYPIETQESVTLYKKLLPFVNQFVCVRQGPFSRSYVGRLVNIDPESLEIQTYYEDGSEADLWFINLSTITEFSAKSRVLNTLALKVKWASSTNSEEAEESEDVETSSVQQA
ncbi:MAG: hypothetical protein VKJ04_08800 [Vampirovibrionales bacterium]|nr:hypothetical protein [Vampirovibrionales bacterium]